MTDFLDGIEAFVQSLAPEEARLRMKLFQGFSAVGPDADADGSGRSRAATLGRDATSASREGATMTDRKVTVYWSST